MDEKELERLHAAVSGKFDIGDFNTFKSKMGTTEDRKRFFDVVGSKGFDLGDYNQYETRVAGVKKKQNGGTYSFPSTSELFGGKKPTTARLDGQQEVNIPQPKVEPKDPFALPKQVSSRLDGKEVVRTKKKDNALMNMEGIMEPLPLDDPYYKNPRTEGNAPIGKAAITGLASVVSSSLKSIGIAAKNIDLFNEYGGKKVEDLATYKAGKWIEDSVKDLVGDLSAEEQDMFAVKLAQGVGQVGGFFLGGLGGRALKLSPLLTTAGLGAAVGGASEYDAAIQSGADDDTAAKVFWANAVIGSTEALPIFGAFRKLDKYTGGLATGALSKKLSSTIAGRLTNEVAQGFITEAAQESVSTILTNTVAANTYDTTRKIYDNLLESAAIGGIIGGAMTGAMGAIREKRMQGGLTKEEDFQLAKAEEFASEKADQATDPNKSEITTTTLDDKKVKSLTKAKTDLEADLSSNTNLPEETKAIMQSEVLALGEQLEVAKTETYQQELVVKEAQGIQENITKNELILEDKNLSEGTKSVIQKNINTDKEKLGKLGIDPKEKQTVQISDEILYKEIVNSKDLSNGFKLGLQEGLDNGNYSKVLDDFQTQFIDAPSTVVKMLGEKTANKLFDRVPVESFEAALTDLKKFNESSPNVKALEDIIANKKGNNELPIQEETVVREELKEPTEEQLLKDVKNKNFVTFSYKLDSEVPEIFKDKVSSRGEINGEKVIRVTIEKSLADYYLSKQEVSLIKKEEKVVREDNGSDIWRMTQDESFTKYEDKTTDNYERNGNNTYQRIANNEIKRLQKGDSGLSIEYDKVVFRGEDGVPIGYAKFTNEGIKNIGVLPEHKGEGITTKMVEYLKKEKGIDTILPNFSKEGNIISHRNEVKKAIAQGKYEKAVADGEMTQSQVDKIIESAGLKKENQKQVVPLPTKETPLVGKEEVVREEEKKFTESSQMNKMYADLKGKYGERESNKLYEAAQRLVNPNENNIVEIRTAGVVVKEGGKYLLKPFGNTDANFKKWTLYKDIDVTDQFKSSDVKSELPSTKEETKSLEEQRDNELNNLTKPDLKINLVSSRELVNSKDPVGNKEIHDTIKEKYKSLKKLIECL